MRIRSSLLALSGATALAGCGGGGPPSDPPTSVTRVAQGGFHAPTDAVASLKGDQFFFGALNDADEGAVFRTSSTPGSSPEAIATGFTLPSGLVMSCDGDTLYVTDLGGDDGGLFAVPTAGGAPTTLGVSGIGSPRGIAMGPDCETLYITGRSGEAPALFAVATSGGEARVILQGEPLVAPTGLHVDDDGVAWVMDHLAVGPNGEGVLFSIPSEGGGATVVASNLRMGTPGGVSLTAGGGNAIMPTRDGAGRGQLTAVNIASGEVTQIPAADMIDPAGLRTAREAGVFAVVDSEGGAIYRAE